MQYTISYIFCTKNRLNFLKYNLDKLIQILRPEEEIVVVDGESTDGTQAYLSNLFEAGKIHQYISEPDRAQAHGWNKALLMANGLIIKKIIDDDIFDYTSIRKCAEYMIANPKVDIVISNDLTSRLTDYKTIYRNSHVSEFEKWAKKQIKSFWFGDIHTLIRKKSLAIFGLYNLEYVMMDWEYSLRISYLQSNIVYYTGYNALSVYHENSVSGQKNDKLIAQQTKKAIDFYDYQHPVSLWSKVKIAIGKMIFAKSKLNTEPNQLIDINSIYNTLQLEIEEINRSGNYKFISRDSY